MAITTNERTIAARIGNTGWHLTGKTAGGGFCDHCNRVLKHCFTVTDPAGRKMTVGRGCVKILTGWTLSASEAARLVWHAERLVVRAANWAAFAATYPEIAATVEADAEFSAAASEIRFNISDGRASGGELKYAQTYLNRR